jgi:hypothetical protein
MDDLRHIDLRATEIINIGMPVGWLARKFGCIRVSPQRWLPIAPGCTSSAQFANNDIP